MMRRLAGLGGSGGGKKGATGAATAISRPIFKLLNDQGNREWEASLSYAAAGLWFAHNELPGSAAWCQAHSNEERGHALKLFNHLAARRIEGDGGEGKAGKGYGSVLAAKIAGEQHQGQQQQQQQQEGGGEKEKEQRRPMEKDLESEEPPQDARVFSWDTSPNVLFDIKGPFPTAFPDPVAIWRAALEQERQNSRNYFQLVQAARTSADFVTEALLMSFYIPEQLEEEKAVEKIYNNALLVTKRGPELYYELDNALLQKPH